jgi:glycosyltransferase involved in cell wall biosynthesis
MKVLFIASWYPNSMNPLKGIFVKKHAAAIKASGVDIEVLALTVSPGKFFQVKIDTTIDEYGIKTHKIEFNSWFYKLIHLDILLQFGFLKQMYYKRIKRNFQPDIIHSNVLYPAAIMGYKLAKKEGLPHIITEHWSGVDKFMNKSLYARTGKKAYDSAKYVAVVSSFLKKSLSKHISGMDKIKVIPNVVDSNIFYFKPKQKNEELVFCCVAHWTGGKRPDLLFGALEKFSLERSVQFRLDVIGEGPLIGKIKEMNWNFKVNYLGNLFKEEIAERLRASDYFLHASNMETFSIVIAEAFSTGTPALASKVGAVPELVNDTNGILCENTIESWMEGLKKITQTHYDNEQISKNSDKYSLLRIGNEFKGLYTTLIQT